MASAKRSKARLPPERVWVVFDYATGALVGAKPRHVDALEAVQHAPGLGVAGPFVRP
jgi:hypothetical protein